MAHQTQLPETTKCRACGLPLRWLYQKPTAKNPNPKVNPIETAPHKKGNLVLNLADGLYRFASQEEIEFAASFGKNLYISHFSNCPNSKEFRRK